MRKVLFMLLFGFFVGQGQAFAQWGAWFGTCGVPCALAGTQSLIWSVAQPWVGPYPYPYPVNYPNQPTVRQPRSGWQKVLLAAGPPLIGVGTGDLINGNYTRGAGLIGGGVSAIMVSQPDRYYVPVQPVQPQPSVQPPQPPAAVPAPAVPVPGPPIVVEPTQPRLAGVQFRVRNESLLTITVEASGRRAVLAPGATARVFTPDIRVFQVQPDGKGSFREVEIDLMGYEDETLPGWRIPDNPRFKAP